MSDIDVDATYHRHRYVTLLWNYAKSKNEEEAISDIEVTGTVDSKYGRPRTQKEKVMDTTIIPLQDHR